MGTHILPLARGAKQKGKECGDLQSFSGIAIRGVSRIYKDVDVSMPMEKQKRKRIHDFQGQ